MQSPRHSVGLIVFTVITAVLVLRPAFIKELPSATTVKDAAESITTSVGQLIPTGFISYLSSIEPTANHTNDRTLSTVAIINATNRVRIKAGLTPLRSNPDLIESTKVKTDDMIHRQYFEHESPEGKEISDLARVVGYNYVIVGENLARGEFADADDLVDEWMNSPGHRANILSPKYQEIGAYAARGMYDGHEVWFAVQHFGTSRSACPVIDSRLKATIDILNKDLSDRRAEIAYKKGLLEGPNHPEVDAYKDSVTAFNELVADYNMILAASQQKIKLYNSQVAAFNTCLNNYKPVK